MAEEQAVIGEGTVVRTWKWGDPPHTGTVVRREGESIFVAWHNSFVEDELTVDDVEVWPDAPEHLRAWRGGVGVFARQGLAEITPMGDGHEAGL